VVLSATELQARTELGRFLIARRAEAPTFLPPGQVAALPQAVPAPELTGKFPTGLAPSAHAPDPNAGPTDKLPRADVVVVTWTVDENDALAAVLTPGFSSRSWSPYSRRYASHYARLIRAGAPAKQAKRLGRWLRTDVGGMSVVCFKSELHLNQDGIRDPNVPGTATLPVKGLFAQLIDEVQPNVVITTGTSGGVCSRTTTWATSSSLAPPNSGSSRSFATRRSTGRRSAASGTCRRRTLRPPRT
jgi:hypothetical protein